MTDIKTFMDRLNTPIIEEPWIAEWSKKVADEMRRNAPRLTGALQNSIQVTDDGVEVGVDYAAFVEYGTSDTAPQPFVGPAVNRLIKPAAKDLGDQVIRQLT